MSAILNHIYNLLVAEGDVHVEYVDEDTIHVIIDDYKAQITCDWEDVVA